MKNRRDYFTDRNPLRGTNARGGTTALGLAIGRNRRGSGADRLRGIFYLRKTAFQTKGCGSGLCGRMDNPDRKNDSGIRIRDEPAGRTPVQFTRCHPADRSRIRQSVAGVGTEEKRTRRIASDVPTERILQRAGSSFDLSKCARCIPRAVLRSPATASCAVYFSRSAGGKISQKPLICSAGCPS